jgi:hypothetical protein
MATSFHVFEHALQWHGEKETIQSLAAFFGQATYHFPMWISTLAEG